MFYATACFDGCHSINEILERSQRIRMDTVSLSHHRSKHCVRHRVHCALCAFHVSYGRVCLLLSAFSLWVLASLKQVMDRLCSSASTVPSIDDYFEHKHVESSLGIAFPRAGQGLFASYIVEIDMAMIALSCHFALDFLCYKEGAHDSS